MRAKGFLPVVFLTLILSCAGTAAAHHQPGHDDDEAFADAAAGNRDELLREERRIEQTNAVRDVWHEKRLAADGDFTAEEKALLVQLDEALAKQRQALDIQLAALQDAQDPAQRQALQSNIDTLRTDIQELSDLRAELLEPLPASVSPDTLKAASDLEQRLERQNQRDERILDQRKSEAPLP